jgi:hypothetical protein
VQLCVMPSCRRAPGWEPYPAEGLWIEAEDGRERRQLARRRYPCRPLVCSLPRGGRSGALSVHGIVMRSSGLVQPGRALLVRVAESDRGPGHTCLARVARVIRRPAGDYLVGCTFTPPLEEQELTALEQLLA